jgi:uncharacterized delta-60 repeat protein
MPAGVGRTKGAILVMSTVNQAPVLTTADANGIVRMDLGSLTALAPNVVLQADGKIVVNVSSPFPGRYAELARYNADGSLDTTFGTDGVISSAPGSATGAGVAVQADGKIVVAGRDDVARYNSDGSFDTSFGTGGKTPVQMQVSSLTIDANGKIVLVGGAGNGFTVTRYDGSGNLDSSFGIAGTLTTSFGSSVFADTHSVISQPDGKLLVAGDIEAGGQYDFALARYNNDGSLDASFGTGGKVTTDFASTKDIAYSVTLQADGKIVAAGFSNDTFSTGDFAVARYNADGSLDASFGVGGKVTTNLGSHSLESAESVRIQPDGKLVVAGYSYVGPGAKSDFVLLRYNSDGSLDSSFGTDGKVVTDLGPQIEEADSLVIQPDGKILVVGTMGTTGANPGSDLALVRYNSDGSLDTSFGAGTALSGPGFFSENAAPTVLNARATVHDTELAVADSYAGASLTLARHGGADAQDLFGASGNLAALAQGGDVVLSGVAIGTVTQNAGGMLVLTFGANATEARVNEAMRDITYANTSDTPSPLAQIDWTFSDGNSGAQGIGGAQAATGLTTVHVTPFNDAPVNTMPGSLGTPAGINYAIAGLSVSDPDSASLTTSLHVDHGKVTIAPVNGVTVLGNGTDWVTLIGSVAQINATLGAPHNVLYRGTVGFSGADTLTMQSLDSGIDPLANVINSVAINVTPAVNNAPVLTTAGNGVATTDFGPLSAQARSVVVQTDGKVVVAGYAQDIQSGAYNSELVRYNADGSIDTTFGTGGIVSSGPSFATGSGVVLQADGKIVTAGAVFGSPNHFALARYNSDGSFDTSFGAAGKVVTDFGSTVPFGMMIQPDGKIVLTGGAGNGANFAVARFNSDGSFDTSFGTGGKVTTDFSGSTYVAGYGVARTPDGKIVVAGVKEFVGSGFDYDFAVARYNDDGSLDTSFGTGGKVTTDFASTDDIPYTVTVQADGKIVVAGITDPGNASNFGLVRYNVDGSLDASFGNGGKVATDFGANFEAGNSVTMQADGKIVVAGFSFLGSFNVDFALARYNSDGSLDTSFGTGGKVTTNFGSNNESAISVVIQPDGKIVLAGSSNNGVAGSGADYAVARYNSDGSLDTSFGVVAPLAGFASYTEGGAPAVLNARATVHDADLDAAGSYAGASLMLARHGGADAQDKFGASGNLAALNEGGNIVLSGVAIGTVTKNSGGTLLLTFGANATEARVNEAIRDITYANSSDTPAASVQIDWSFSDHNTGGQGSGGALAAIGSTVVNITAVNDAPVNVIAPQTATEDARSAITGLSVSDPDIGSGHITVTLTVQHGTILVRDDVSGGIASPDITHNGTASVTLSGDAALLNATLASGLTYRANFNYNGTDTLTMLSDDGGNTGTGGNKTDSDTVNIVVASVNDAPVISATKNANAIVRVSTDAAGVQGNGASFDPVFSPDGSKIAFSSDASNLVAGDTNNGSDIFVKNLATGAITRVSTDAAGGQGEGFIGSKHPVFSPDGSKIAFDSFASNLVPGDNNFSTDIFVKDLATGAITRIGSNTPGSESYFPVFSPDGNRIAFYSYAQTLVAGDLNNRPDVFVKNLTTGTITLVSTDAAGHQSNANSLDPVFSPDGSKIAFFSGASNLVAGVSNGGLFLKDLGSGQITLVSAAANGTPGNNSSTGAVFSPDGSKIAFHSFASNLVSGDGNGVADVFVKDLVTGAVTRVSTDAAGAQGNGASVRPAFSPDGSKIAFFSDATNLVVGDSNGVTDAFVKDLATGAITRISTDGAGAQSNNNSFSSATFSPDGGKIAFSSSASNLVAGDGNGAADIFVKKLVPDAEDPAAYIENASAVRVNTQPVTITDVDNTNFSGGSLTAGLTAGSHAGDNLTLIVSVTPGTGIEVSGSAVKYNGATIGMLSGNDTASLGVALNGSATAAAVQALAGAVGFSSSSNDPTADARTVTFTLVDGSGTAGGGHDTGSFTQTVLVTPVNDAPQISFPNGTNVAASAGQSLAASSLFIGSDANGDAVSYYIYDATPEANSGHFVVNGTVVPASTIYTVTAAQFAQTTFVAGASGTSDLLFALATDGQANSNNDVFTPFHVNVANHAPVLTVPSSNVAAGNGQVLSASSLFTATDADGDTLTYFFQDGTAAANSGRFVLNGTPYAQGAAFNVSAAQLAQLSFVAGSVDDDLSMQLADDKGALSAGAAVHVHANHAPVLTVSTSTVTANVNQSLQAASLFSATDADGDTLTYFFQDGTSAANSGHFVLNGTALAQGAGLHLTGTAQLAQLTFVAGSVDDDLSMQLADDKGALSAGAAVHVHANHAPVLTVPGTATANAGQSVQAASLFSATDADGDTLTYFFQDGTSAANSGHFVLNGTAIAQGAGFHVTGAAQLAQLSFVAGSVDDDLSMQLADDKGALSAAAGFHFHVNQAPVLTVPGTVMASPNQSLQASSLFTATDAENDTLTYFFQDGTAAANSGHFVLNGTAIAQGAGFHVTGTAQLAQLSFLTGSVDDDLSMQVADNHGALSAGAGFHIMV